MSTNYQCNACKAIYPDTQPDGSANFHVCADVVTPGKQPDPTLPGYTPPTITPLPNKRNENIRPGVQYFDGKPCLLVADAGDPSHRTAQPLTSIIISEGAGRTAV